MGAPGGCVATTGDPPSGRTNGQTGETAAVLGGDAYASRTELNAITRAPPHFARISYSALQEARSPQGSYSGQGGTRRRGHPSPDMILEKHVNDLVEETSRLIIGYLCPAFPSQGEHRSSPS